MIKISYDMRRILKALLNMEGSIQISNTPNGTLINYTYKDGDIYIGKEFNSNKYEIGQCFEGYSTMINFTTQSSVISYLKNNFQ